ncbi:MAG: phenylalanine--tRNA ligase subunit beta, partial [Chloroflexi bacterium]|nr:phenylalanine--tRNA ligase subunit beta [Chloroflexota bacterium]
MAAERTIALLVELCGGTAADGIVDAYPRRWEPRRIEVREREIAALLGKTYERAEVARVLESLDFSVEAGGGQLVVTVPMHRLDVEGRADLAEEVARITGYDEIPDTMPTGAMPEPTVDALRAAAERARDVLVGCGLQEVMTYSMVAPGSTARLEDGAASDDEIEASNPLTVDQSVLRSRLLPSLLDTVHDNLRHRERVAIFEIARVYLPPLDPLPSERLRLAIAMTGPADAAAWNVNARSVDFFDLKGAIEELLGAFGVSASYEAAVTPWLHPGRGAAVRLQDAAQAEVELGPFGQLHPDAAERFDLRGREVFVAEIDFERLVR